MKIARLIGFDAFRSREVKRFQNTLAYSLAKAVEDEKLEKIKKIVSKNPNLLIIDNPVSGTNILFVALSQNNYETLKILLELGGNPNSISSDNKVSLLIQACSYNEYKFIKLLLEAGANSNYTIDKDTMSPKGHTILITSPLLKASSKELSFTKLLIKHGALPNKRAGKRHPLARVLSNENVDLAYYYIEELEVDIFQPMDTFFRHRPVNRMVTFYIQDCVRPFGKPRPNEDPKFIQYLEKKGVKFEGYNYVM